MPGAAAIPRFVGRVAELRRLDAAYARVGSGETVTLCVSGEAGVGKTRLVTHFASGVGASGAWVLRGGCVELGEGSLPYAPLVEVLRGLVRELDAAVLGELIGPGRPLLAGLLPEIGAPGGSTTATASAGWAAQARLFEAFLALFERLAGRHRIVLFMEDLHWADRSTLDLLTFLVRNLRAAILIVLTYRSDELRRPHGLRPFLAELDRSAGVDRLELGRFDRLALGELLTGILGSRPDDELWRQIYQRSQGNAFFAEELLAAAGQRPGNGPSLPASIQNALLSRVQLLPDDAQATLRIIAAGGGRVEHELLAAVSELPRTDLLAALRAAVAYQVLMVDPVTESYLFRHALTQEALYNELLPGERVELHTAFARALTEHPDVAVRSGIGTPARLAYHWTRAHEPARALPAAVDAGRHAEAAYAFADAHEHFETALKLWAQVGDADAQLGVDHAAVLEYAAESAYLSGDPSRAIALTRTALRDVDPAGNPLRAGLLHGRLGGYLWATGGEGAFAEYEAAVRLVPTDRPLAERARVLAAYGEALTGLGQYRQSREVCEDAIRIARLVGARAEEGDAHRALGADLALLGDLDAGIGHLLEARQIAEELGKVDDLARALATLSGLLDTFGEFEQAAEVALQGAELAASHGLRRWHSPFLAATAGKALFALGRWDDAERLLRQAADEIASELAAARVYIHSACCELEAARGRAASAAEHLAVAGRAYTRTVTRPWFAAPLFGAAAELALSQNRLDDADAAVAGGLQVVGGDLTARTSLYALGLRATADRAELARARRADDELLTIQRIGGALASDLRTAMTRAEADGMPPTPRAEAAAVLGEAELARIAGHLDPYPWEAAAKTWAGLSQPYPAAYARWREAEALLLAGVARGQVAQALRAAQLTATELGAVPLRTEVEDLARRARLDLTADTADPSPERERASPLDQLGLTTREQEVLALVAAGRTNREIAQALFISPKTATVHVTHILAKLGVRGRVEAAAVAHRLGVVEPHPKQML
jgi:DNA-binding CsgD family transcriptional regulator/tetratricopeptide (TPR) repeat protein